MNVYRFHGPARFRRRMGLLHLRDAPPDILHGTIRFGGVSAQPREILTGWLTLLVDSSGACRLSHCFAYWHTPQTVVVHTHYDCKVTRGRIRHVDDDGTFTYSVCDRWDDDDPFAYAPATVTLRVTPEMARILRSAM
jgi:hypothetical protein